jgi:dCMP deaminase
MTYELRQVPDWDSWFLGIAFEVEKRSKDPHTQVGCVIVDREHVLRATGYNGMVAGMEETPEHWDRPTKYALVCHAEFNAVALAARVGVALRGCTAYVTRFPCLTCTRLLIQAGISRVVVAPKTKLTLGYRSDFDKAIELLLSVGVEVSHEVIFE